MSKGNKVDLSYRPVIVDPLTTEDEGGITLKKIAPEGAHLLRRRGRGAMNAMADGLMGKPMLRARLGFEPGLVLRMHGMRRSGRSTQSRPGFSAMPQQGGALFLKQLPPWREPARRVMPRSRSTPGRRRGDDGCRANWLVRSGTGGFSSEMLLRGQFASLHRTARANRFRDIQRGCGLIDHEVQRLSRLPELGVRRSPRSSSRTRAIACRGAMAVILRGVDLYADLLGEVKRGRQRP